MPSPVLTKAVGEFYGKRDIGTVILKLFWYIEVEEVAVSAAGS